jgi:hypothetical protein
VNFDRSQVSWIKSQYCGNAACVEVAQVAADAIAIRDSKDPQGPVLMFDRAEWDAFTAGVADGGFQFK